MIADRNVNAGEELVFVLLVLTRNQRVGVRSVQTGHAISPVVVERSILTIWQVQAGQPHIPEGYTLTHPAVTHFPESMPSTVSNTHSRSDPA